MAPPVVISLEVIAQKHESNPFGFELGLLAKASYQGHATGRRQEARRAALATGARTAKQFGSAPKAAWTSIIWAEQLKKIHFGFELGLLAKASYQGHATGGETIWKHTKGCKDFYKSGPNNMSLIHFGFELGLLSKASYQGQSTGCQKKHTKGCMDFHKSGQNN